MPRERQADPNKPDRPERVPLHEQRDKINVKTLDDASYVHRWVNIAPDRIEKFKLAGWEMAPGDTKFGDKAVEDQVTRTSSVVERHMGQGVKAVLMRIPRDYYEQDQKDKQRTVDLAERAMRREALKDRYGKFGPE